MSNKSDNSDLVLIDMFNVANVSILDFARSEITNCELSHTSNQTSNHTSSHIYISLSRVIYHDSRDQIFALSSPSVVRNVYIWKAIYDVFEKNKLSHKQDYAMIIPYRYRDMTVAYKRWIYDVDLIRACYPGRNFLITRDNYSILCKVRKGEEHGRECNIECNIECNSQFAHRFDPFPDPIYSATSNIGSLIEDDYIVTFIPYGFNQYSNSKRYWLNRTNIMDQFRKFGIDWENDNLVLYGWIVSEITHCEPFRISPETVSAIELHDSVMQGACHLFDLQQECTNLLDATYRLENVSRKLDEVGNFIRQVEGTRAREEMVWLAPLRQRIQQYIQLLDTYINQSENEML